MSDDGGYEDNCSGPQNRIRNVLTLEERVAAIRQYDIVPMYSAIAKSFNCSWEQIKSIVSNREQILEFYEATRRTNKPANSKCEELRRRKLNFLSQCLYEYIQRAQYYLHADLNEEMIRTKALEFRDLMGIENFMPNKPWINHFKADYNITLSNRQITLTRRPPRSLNLRDIMSYCGKNAPSGQQQTEQLDEEDSAAGTPLQIPTKSMGTRSLYRTKTQAAVSSANQATLEEVQLRRKRKINFLEKALYEYMQRSQIHHKGRLDLDNLRTVAISLRDILKIENFFPDKMWFNHFKSHYNFNLSQGVTVTNRRVPLSLDLRDIVSYCGRNEQRDQPVPNITLTPKEATKPNQNHFVHQPFVEPKEETELQANDADDDDCVAIEVPPELIEIKDDDDEDLIPTTRTGLKRELASLSNAETHSKIKKKIDATELLEPAPSLASSSSSDSELPRSVQSYEDALRLLKPIEEFALIEENYRVIGLLTQLEKILKSSKEKKTS